MNKYLCVILALCFHFANAQKEPNATYQFLKKIDDINYLNDSKNKSSIDSLQLIIDNSSNDTIKGYFYRIQAKFLISQLEHDVALKSLDKSIAFYKNANNSMGIIKSMMNKGGVLYQKGETKKATQEYVNALAIAEKRGYKNEIAALYKNIGLVYYSQGKTKEALAYNNKALDIFNQLKSKKDIENITIKTQNNIPLKIKDIAEVNLTSNDRRGVAELNGEGEVVGGIVVTRYGVDVHSVIKNVKAKLHSLNIDDVEIVEVYDRTSLIDAAIDTLKRTLIEESIIVMLIVGIFLLHFRSALIIIITLPLTVMISFLFM